MNNNSQELNTNTQTPGPNIGERVGKLRILAYVGSGGMANIYKVLHEELEVIRAIKMLKPGYDEDTKSRFQTESKISAHLDHPNIVHIYSTGIWNKKLPYLEMEFVDGNPLEYFIKKQQALPLKFSLSVIKKVCDALEYAQKKQFTVYGKHYEGLVHRDIKPANILLSSKGIVKLADFGIALPGNISIHTMDASTMGTYAYLSPEQLDGKQLDHRSDIYSIGAVLYEMLTGLKAFPDKNIAQLVKNKFVGNYRPIKVLMPKIPKNISIIVDKCLEYDRNKRYKNIEELKTAINIALQLLIRKQTHNINTGVVPKIDTQSSIPSSSTKHSKPNFMIWIIISFFLIAIATGLLLNKKKNSKQILLTKRVHSYYQNKPINKEDSSNTNTTFYKKRKYNSKKSSYQKKPELSKQKTFITQKKELPDLEMQGNIAFNQNDYEKARIIFEKLLLKNNLSEKVKINTVLRLIETYINMNKFDKALQVCNSTTIKDGYLYFLEGKILYLKEKFNLAEIALEKAQTMPSIKGLNAQRKATYWWALNKESLFYKKPNIKNKLYIVTAWQSYYDAWCNDSSNSADCNKAINQLNKFQKRSGK